jgi:hypothetical protein
VNLSPCTLILAGLRVLFVVVPWLLSRLSHGDDLILVERIIVHPKG